MKKKMLLSTLILTLAIGISGCASPDNASKSSNSNTSTSISSSQSSKSDTSTSVSSSQDSSAKVTENAPMEYISKEDLQEAITSNKSEYVLLDVRKKADYDKDHIENSLSSDLDGAVNGDSESGITNLKAAIKEATGKEEGNPDSKYVLLCYKGKSYAQKGTDLLIDMGINSKNIYTLKDGYAGWTEK